MRIVILADDFSGAAELAGIAASRGWKAEVQTRFDPECEAEVIAVDTDTRLRSESEAVRVVGEVARAVVASKPDWIYKKTDWVHRWTKPCLLAIPIFPHALRWSVNCWARPNRFAFRTLVRLRICRRIAATTCFLPELRISLLRCSASESS